MVTAGTQYKRTVLRVSGADSRAFLQGLVSNDVQKLDAGLVYAALLTPQGKYLADFFLVPDGADVLVDLATDQAAAILQRLNMYKLRADVTIVPTDIGVARGLDMPPEGAFGDPRHADMGWRHYGAGLTDSPERIEALERRRVDLCIPESGAELVSGETYILEVGFEALNGVDFRKGCYVGQEIVARMKHKTELRKGLRKVRMSQIVPVGTEILSDGKPAGTLYSQVDGQGLAYLRFDRIGPNMTAGAATLEIATEA